MAVDLPTTRAYQLSIKAQVCRTVLTCAASLCTVISMGPFLARFAIPSKTDLPAPAITYDPKTETLQINDGSDQLSVWLTGSTMTKATGDPTSDEASDR